MNGVWFNTTLVSRLGGITGIIPQSHVFVGVVNLITHTTCCCCCYCCCLYDAGMCESENDKLIREIKTNTVYQFRVQLSPAHSCHCVNIETVGDINLDNRWCEASSNVLCAKNELTMMTYLSQPVVTMMNASLEPAPLDCGHQFVKLNVTDIAIAHEGTFESCPKHQCLFPLMPLTSVNNKM